MCSRAPRTTSWWAGTGAAAPARERGRDVVDEREEGADGTSSTLGGPSDNGPPVPSDGPLVLPGRSTADAG
ncbi:hypothetical protein GCM10028777_23500 [Angustibacter speluncae]